MYNTANVLVYIPYGFSIAQRAVYIKRIKEGLKEAFDVAEGQSRVYVVEARKEDACFYWNDSMSNNIFIPSGYTLEQKNLYCQRNKEAVEAAFGDAALPTFVTFDEHARECEYVNRMAISGL